MKTNIGLFKLFKILLTLTAALSGIVPSTSYAQNSPPTPPPFSVNGNAASNAFATTCKKSSASPATLFFTKAMSNIWILPDSAIRDMPFAACNIDISITKGETESASFVIHADQNVKNIRITGVEFTGTPQPGSNITIDFKLVKPWYQADSAGQDIGRSLVGITMVTKILTPELLVNDLDLVRVDTKTRNNYLRTNDRGSAEYIDINSSKDITHSVDHFFPEYQVRDAATLQPFSVDAGKNQQIWLTISAAKNIAPGRYTGIVNMVAEGANLSIDVNINVPKFELPPPKLEYGIYYHGRLHENKTPTVSSVFKTPEQLKLELNDIAFHGITFPVIYQDHNNESLFLKYIQIMSDAGFSTKNLYLVYLNTQDATEIPSQTRALQNNILRIKSITKKFGTNTIYVYGIDEAKGSKLTAQKSALGMVQGLGEKTYVAGAAGVYEALGDLLDILVFAESPMKAEADKYHSKGRKIFSYANPQSGVENPYLYRKNYGLLLWAAEFDGALLYAYQHFMGEGWNDFDATYRDHNFTYPTANGFVRTTGWEGVREAVDDVRYVTLLETRIKNVKENNLRAKIATADEATTYLNNLKNTLNRTNSYGRRSQPLNIDLDEIRQNMIRYIDLLES